jgi:uncharacterized protein
VKQPAIKIKLPMDSIKETSWRAILLFSVLYCIYISFVNFVVFRSDILDPLARLTRGLVNQTLILNLFSVIIFVFIIISKYGKLSFHDLGLKKNRILSAAAAILTLWISIQLLNIIVSLIISGKPVIYSGWSKNGVTVVFGNFFAQLFGNCLFEELAFRGFLLVQICKKLRNKKWNLFTQVFVSQLLFALIHIPNRIMAGMDVVSILTSLVFVLIIGVLFSAAYLITDNLFLAIGIHALWNMPLLVFDGMTSTLVLFVFILILPMIWYKSFGRLGSESNSSLSAKL